MGHNVPWKIGMLICRLVRLHSLSSRKQQSYLPVTSQPPIWQLAFWSFISLELRDPWNREPVRNAPTSGNSGLLPGSLDTKSKSSWQAMALRECEAEKKRLLLELEDLQRSRDEAITDRRILQEKTSGRRHLQWRTYEKAGFRSLSLAHTYIHTHIHTHTPHAEKGRHGYHLGSPWIAKMHGWPALWA